MKTPEEIKLAIDRQKHLCETQNLPHFAPSDGKCYDCGNNIYQDMPNSQGYTGLSFVTGCPHCHYSYCE